MATFGEKVLGSSDEEQRKIVSVSKFEQVLGQFYTGEFVEMKDLSESGGGVIAIFNDLVGETILESQTALGVNQNLARALDKANVKPGQLCKINYEGTAKAKKGTTYTFSVQVAL